VEREPGQWEPHEVGDGLWQGSCEASAVFCLGVREALKPAIADLAAKGIRVDLLKYIDDMLLSVSPSDLQAAWPALEEALAAAGLTLVPSKCAAYVPAATERDPRITAFVEQRFDGLPLLGTAVDGHLESFLGPFALGLEPARARLDRALTLIGKIEEMAQATLPSHVLQPAWCLLSQCAAHALDFDLRVHSPGAITPFAQTLSDAVVRCAARILGRAELGGTARDQLLLPVAEGGCGLPDLPLMAPAARLSAALQVRPVVASRLRACGWSAQALDAFLPCDSALEAQASLRESGVLVTSACVPCRAPLADGVSEIDLLTPPAPPDGLFSLIMALRYADSRCRLLVSLSAEGRVRVRSAGGPSAGLWLRAVPDSDATCFSDSEFRRALLWRLGLPQAPAGASCRLRPVSDPSAAPCAAPLGSLAEHAVVCKNGRGVARVHGFLRDSIAGFCRQAGLEAATEVVQPGWSSSWTADQTGAWTSTATPRSAAGAEGRPVPGFDGSGAGGDGGGVGGASSSAVRASSLAPRVRPPGALSSGRGVVCVPQVSFQDTFRVGDAAETPLADAAGLARAAGRADAASPAAAAAGGLRRAAGGPRAAREAREAIIDVEAWDPHSADTLCVDATVRHAAAIRYRPQASDYDGHALRIAEAEKQARYPPRGGLRCTCAAAETYGRLGDSFEALIDDLAGRAARRDVLRGLPPTPWARRWRVQLSVGVHRALARSLEEAIRGPAGAERPRGAACAR
jgi:hypothetical protein